MKIVNIFGLVVAVHVAVLLLIFAIPGCRTSAKNPPAEMGAAPTMETAAPSSVSSPIQPAPMMSAADLNPPLAGSAYPSTPAASGSGGRYSPTRPGSAPAITPANGATSAAAPTRSYTVVRGDSLWTIAKRHGVTVRELTSANNLRANAVLQLGQVLQLPDASPATTPTSSAAAAATPASGSGNYTIKPGDTLGAIAKRHGTTVSALKAMNNLRSDLVRVGDTLVIPDGIEPAPAAPAPRPAAAASTSNASNNPAARAANGSAKHVVAPGETLGAIARKYDVRLGDLALANNITDPTRIRPGQELVIPGAAHAAAPASQVPTQYPPSFQPAAPATDDTPTINTSPAEDDVPIIRVEEATPTLQVEPAPGGGGAEPPLFN